MTDLDLFFDSLKDVAMATRYSWTNLICRAAILKRIQVAQFRYQKIKKN